MFAIVNPHWILVWLPVVCTSFACLIVLRRRAELSQFERSSRELAEAKERGSHKAPLQHPDIDHSVCMGCGSCVASCPEEGVLRIIHGQSHVVHGARCVGHARCAARCPANAIAITLGDLSNRRDLPAINEEFEAVGVPGLFLAGEVTGLALVHTALKHGVAVADAVFRRLGAKAKPGGGRSDPAPQVDGDLLDLLIVGAGPGGMACALRAKELGISFLVVDQAQYIGGTVAAYPRRKMVMTQPVDLPLHGRLPKLTYQKEELIQIWEGLATEHSLPTRTGVRLMELRRSSEGTFCAVTNTGEIQAKMVCLALGRRGTPRKLEIPGEELMKVAYSLLDAEYYQGRRILIVGGGDSAIEAAVALSRQPGNHVTISYRKKAFFRLKSRNEAAIQEALQEHLIECLYESGPTEILSDSVRLRVGEGELAKDIEIPNDEVFVFAGGTPPFEVLEKAGVSFDAKDRPQIIEPRGDCTVLLVSLFFALASSILVGLWMMWFRDYYNLDMSERVGSPLHVVLRPSSNFGFAFACLACVLFLCNLAYLARKSFRWGESLGGRMRVWMGAHVFTGIFALLCVVVHAGFELKNTAGGHALLALLVVVLAGFVGRYLYAVVPRAMKSAEAELEDVRLKLASVTAAWDGSCRDFGAEARRRIDELVSSTKWSGRMLGRLYALMAGELRFRRLLHRLREEARKEGVSSEEIHCFLGLARRSYRLTLQTIRYEEVRAVLSTWRYYHRWLALLMVLLAFLHIYTAIRYGQVIRLGQLLP